MMKLFNFLILLITLSSMFSMLVMSMPSFYKMFHPMIMGSILMMFSIITSQNLSLYYNNNWISFIMFLVMIGGMMILFLYFTSFISNMITSMKIMFIKLFSLKILLIFNLMIYLILIIQKFLIWYNNFSDIETLMNTKNYNFMNFSSNIIFSYIYNKNFTTIISIMYLLIILTLIVKIIMMNKFTLRKIN